MVADQKEMMASFYQSIMVSIAMGILFIILSGIVAVKFAGSIAKPVSLVCRRLELLASGDLHTQDVEVRSKDEIEILAVSLNKTVNSLRSYITVLAEFSGALPSNTLHFSASKLIRMLITMLGGWNSTDSVHMIGKQDDVGQS